MLLECPACRAQATLRDSQEGARVRCPECGHVYRARAAGTRARDRGASRSRWIVGVGTILGLLALFLLMRSRGGSKEPVRAAPVPEVVPKPVPSELLSDWDSDIVQAAVALHEAAAAGDARTLAEGLFGPGLLAWHELSESLGDADAALDTDPLDSDRAASLAALPRAELSARVLAAAQAAIDGADLGLIAGWRPYDVEGLERSDERASFRLAVTARDPERAAEKRFVEWRMVKVGASWKGWAWRRWIDPDEVVARKRHGTELVKLSDGAEVLERQPEPLGHLDDTPAELRELIDAAFETMLDLNLTTESSAAQRRLISIGRPAIPILLNELYQNPLETEDQCIQANLAVGALRRITGKSFGYRPRVGDVALGTTKERQLSSIKQWFAWWYRNELTFEKKEEKDGLEGLIELTEEDERWLQRHRNNE